jgi:hypothetical protein
MYSRLILSTMVLLAVAVNQPGLQPGLTKEAHAPHGGRASATNNGASGTGTRGAVSGANTPAAKSSVPIDAEETVAPPVLPPHGPKPQPNQNANQNPKIVTPGNAARGQAGGAIAPTSRNAIGQPVVAPKNLTGVQSPVPALQRPVSPPLVHGVPVAAPVSSGAARVNVANAANHGSINGATVIRPSTAPAGVGGPARAANGINGTTVHSRR